MQTDSSRTWTRVTESIIKTMTIALQVSQLYIYDIKSIQMLSMNGWWFETIGY